MAWQYKREEKTFEQIPEGNYRVRIKQADKAMSKKGNDMLTLQLEVSGSKQILYHYITFMDDKPEITNRMLTQFFDAFPGIPEGDFNMKNWIGKVGACKVKHEEYNGNMQAKVHYFISADRQKDLPPWKEPDGIKTDDNGYIEVNPADLDDLPPFE